MSVRNKIKSLLPYSLSRRFGVFAGTNDFHELKIAFFSLFQRDFHNKKIIQKYEQQFAQKVGATSAFSFGAGRMALYAILKALDFKPGDEIILPAFTCVVVPNAMIYAGVVPVYADIHPETFNLDPTQIENRITAKTRAIYLQNTFGLISGYAEIREIVRKHGLKIIEDAAHSLGSKNNGVYSGSLGDVGFFSTDHSKVINTLVGGMVTTSDPVLAERLRQIQSQAGKLSSCIVRRILFSFIFEQIFYSPLLLWIGEPLFKILYRARLLFFFSDELEKSIPTNYPYPCPLPSPLAQIGIHQLSKLEINLAHRQKIAVECETVVGAYRTFSREIFTDSAWLRYSFMVPDRKDFEKFMNDRFTLGTWFTSVVHGRNTDLEKVGYTPGSCPVAEKVARSIVNVPTHPKIKKKLLVKKLKKYFNQHEA